MPTELNPQTIITSTIADQILPRKSGYSTRTGILTKVGSKNIRDLDFSYGLLFRLL